MEVYEKRRSKNMVSIRFILQMQRNYQVIFRGGFFGEGIQKETETGGPKQARIQYRIKARVVTTKQ